MYLYCFLFLNNIFFDNIFLIIFQKTNLNFSSFFLFEELGIEIRKIILNYFLKIFKYHKIIYFKKFIKNEKSKFYIELFINSLIIYILTLLFLQIFIMMK